MQTDLSSAFVVDHVKFASHLVWSSCKIWLLFPILCARTQEVLKIWGTLGPHSWGGGVSDVLETRYSPTCVITPNFVAVDQTVWAYIDSPKNFRDAKAPFQGRGWRYSPTCATTPNFVGVGRGRFGLGRSQKFPGSCGAAPWNVDVADSLEICFFLTCVAVPNLVILRQTVLA